MAAPIDVDVVDLSDEEEGPPKPPAPPTAQALRSAVIAELEGRDLASVSLKTLRRSLEARFGLVVGAFDARRDEIKATAQELVDAAAQGPQARENDTVVEATSQPLAKRRKTSLLVAGAPPPADAAAVPSAGAAGPDAKQKRKAAPSAYALWTGENRARVSAELAAASGAKPGFGDLARALAERWKAEPPDAKAAFEAKASQAKAEAALGAPGPARPAGRGRGGGQGGKGRGRGGQETPPLTRAEFLGAGVPLRASLEGGGSAVTFQLDPRLFKSGGAGWFQGQKFKVAVAGQELTLQAQVNVSVLNSKHWEDGEGLDKLTAKAADPPEEAADQAPSAEAAPASGTAAPAADEEAADPAPSAEAAPASGTAAPAADEVLAASRLEPLPDGPEAAPAAADLAGAPGGDRGAAEPAGPRRAVGPGGALAEPAATGPAAGAPGGAAEGAAERCAQQESAAAAAAGQASPACPESAAVDPVGAAAELAATGAAGASEGAAEQGAQEGDATGVACQAEKAEGAVAEQAPDEPRAAAGGG